VADLHDAPDAELARARPDVVTDIFLESKDLGLKNKNVKMTFWRRFGRNLKNVKMTFWERFGRWAHTWEKVFPRAAGSASRAEVCSMV
jgi:hypothetical protein